jgi:inner membrane protein
MTAPTHVTFGALSYFVMAAAMQWQPSTAAVATAALGSLLPDIDLPTSAVGRPFFPISKALNEQIGHRTLTHSVIGIMLLLMMLSPLLFIDSLIVWALAVGYISHLLIDTVNKAGIELLYPSHVRAWFLSDERYRIVVGSREEFILLAVLMVFTIAFFPVTIRGFTGTLHYLLGDVDSAITDFYRMMPTHDVTATVAAIDIISQEQVRGEFPVLGVDGNNALIVRHDGRLREIGHTGHLRPERVRMRQGEPHKIVEQQVEMGGHVLREIEPFAAKGEVYLFGTLHVVTDKNPEIRLDAFNPVRRNGSTLVLEYAAYSDLVAGGFHFAPVEQGVLILKSVLAPDATIQPVTLGSPVNSVSVLTVKVKDLADLVVSPGGAIVKGKPLVRDQEAARQLDAVKAEIENENERWEHQQAINSEDLRTVRDKAALQEQAVHRLTEKRETYASQDNSVLFGKELKQLTGEIAAETAKLKDLQGDVAQEEKRQKVETVQHREKLRALTDRTKKLEGEAVVLANVSGKVISMEAEHGAEHITVKLAVATEKEKTDGQEPRGSQGEQASRLDPVRQ